MKIGQSIFVAVTLLSFSHLTAYSKIWRVDNTGSGGSAQFTSLQQAHNSILVEDGDTLHVSGSGVSYGSVTLIRPLKIYGPGYFLADNPETQANLSTAKGITMIFNSGSEGSVITGMEFGRAEINANNITVMRNLITTANTTPVSIRENRSNITLIQNYIFNQRNGSGTSIAVDGANSNILISNNFIEAHDSPVNSNSGSSSINVVNNVIRNRSPNPVALNNSIFHNNIVINAPLSGSGNSVFNNLSDGEQVGVGNGNQINVDMNTVFVGTGSTDGKWQLSENSPAKGAGVDGVDAGMFGGENPYVLSGLPPIPAIYDIQMPTLGTRLHPVKVKAKTHN